MNVQASDCENGLVPGHFQPGAVGVSRGAPELYPGRVRPGYNSSFPAVHSDVRWGAEVVGRGGRLFKMRPL